MSKGERLEGRVRDVVASGDGVVETARGVVFARGALAGERVIVSLDGKPGRVQRGRVFTVLDASPARVVPSCPHAARCGGCPLMHATYEAQRELKARFLREALLKVGASPELVVTLHETERVLGYRRRVRLAYRVTRGARELGYRRERSHELVDIVSCGVMEPVLEAALRALREQLLTRLSAEGELLLARGKHGGAVAVLRTNDVQPPDAYAAAEQVVASGALEGLALFAAGATKPASFGEPTEWSEGADGQPLEGTLGGFSQAHAEVNRALVRRVAELARTQDSKVLELYAGHGNFTVALAGAAASYTAVEQDPSAIAALRRNLAARGITAKVVQADAGTQVGSGALDVLVLDPPRTGAKGVLAAAAARKPKRIVYVSCDPATLARDVSEALERGYRITSAEGFDMFPQTADLESVVLLER